VKKTVDAEDLEPKGEHYFTKRPTSAPRPRLLHMFVNGKGIQLNTSSGIFSPRRIDIATLLLIENMRLGKKVLDLGCGYGPIGIAAAVSKPGCSVTMAEINERAAELARDNVSLNRIFNATVVESDFFDALKGEKFDTILMNPPMAAGLKRLFDVIVECKEHLLPKGTLQIVARHGKGGERVAGRMEAVFGKVETVAKGAGFRVYLSICST
jgi:16S rRNA (guanine1207-N2)-methyltransferase